MKQNLFNKKLTVLFVLLISVEVVAQNKQNECINSLESAGKMYEAGNFTQSIDLLNPCLNQFGKQEQFEAYRLLGLSYLYLNNTTKANESVVEMLKLKPDYRDFPYFDPLDFTKMLARYDVWSKRQVGFKAGVNFNSIRPIKNYSMTGSEATFLPETGFQTGIIAEYFFRKKTSANIEILVEGLSYTRTADDVSGWNQEFKEKMTFLSIPLGVRHYFYQKKTFGIGLELGIQSQFLLRTNSNIILENPETGESFQNTLDQKSQRNKVLFSLYPGILLQRKMGTGWFIANVRYGIGLTNVVNPDKRYENLAFSISNQYVDSDIAFKPLYISLGYQGPFPKMYAVKLRK